MEIDTRDKNGIHEDTHGKENGKDNDTCISGYAVVPHPVATIEDMRRRAAENPPEPLSQEDLDWCRRLGLTELEIEEVSLISAYLRKPMLRLRENINRKQKEKELAAQQELEAISRGEMTADMQKAQRAREYARRLIQEEEKSSRERVARHYRSPQAIAQAGLPRIFRSMTMEQIISRGVPTHLLYQQGRVASYIDNLDKCLETGTGLIFTGPWGTLKTTFACSILLAGFRMGIEGRFELVMQMLDRLNALEKENQSEYQAAMKQLCTVPLLVLDDMGAEGRRGDFVKAKLEQIIFRRHAELKPTIITTNLTSQELVGLYSMRIMDRLAERCPILAMEGPSNRTGRGWDDGQPGH